MDFKDDVSGYGSHVGLLKFIYDELRLYLNIPAPENVLEFGMGKFSTVFFLSRGSRVISIEMQSEEWYQEMLRYCADNRLQQNWIPIKNINADGTITAVSFFPDYFNLAFVDGHGSTRPECVNMCFDLKIPLIVAHDTDNGWYGWERVRNHERYVRFRYDGAFPNSDLWILDVDLKKHDLKISANVSLHRTE